MFNVLSHIEIVVEDGRLLFKNAKMKKGTISARKIKKLNQVRKTIRAGREVDPKTLGRRLR